MVSNDNDNGIVEVKMMWNESWYCWLNREANTADAIVTLSAINAGPGRAADSDEWWGEICDHTSADNARSKLSVSSSSTQQKQRRASAAAIIITLFLPSTRVRLRRVIRIETWSFKRRWPTRPTPTNTCLKLSVSVCSSADDISKEEQRCQHQH